MRAAATLFANVSLAVMPVGCVAEDEPALEPFVAVTFNTGTSLDVVGDVDADDNDGYGADEAAISDAAYGNGLAFSAFVDASAAAIADVTPDIMGLQEIFFSGDCIDIPAEQRPGFVCADYVDGDPTVAQRLVGPGYQVACHLNKPDKCIAVKRSFASIRGCDDDLCLDFLDGVVVEGCGGGSRLGRATLDLVAGGSLVVINVHGTSGFSDDDVACRARQFASIFSATDDGGPLVIDGEDHVIVGDFNTDPGRLFGSDRSADVILDHVGQGHDLHFVTAIGSDAPPTYTLFNIDHVISDAFDGDCVHPGVDGDAIIDARYFDHRPAICTLRR